ncbi:MAG: amine dehydrogenase large subunit [Gammaproteobacteria bacterium]
MKTFRSVYAITLFVFSMSALAELAVETPTTRTLPKQPSPHWMWVSDLNFYSMEAGKAYLLDGDSGQVMGMLSTGYFFASAVHSSDHSLIYSPETYLSRGTRGERTDIIAVYDPQTLAPIDEIAIPAKRFSGVPVVGHTSLSADNKFMATFNFTPAQSVSIIDAPAKKFLGEVETPGCAQVFQAGNRAFNMICGDGTMLTLKLDDSGAVTTSRSKQFFDPKSDMLDDKMDQIGTSWVFFSKSGKVHEVDMANGEPTFLPTWPLFTAQQLADNWRLGGYQYAAIHDATKELYVIVHRGDEFSHKAPGVDVWVYDLERKKRVRMITLSHPATAIRVTQDNEPLLFTVDAEHSGANVYHAKTGEHHLDIPEVGMNPLLMWAP